MKKHKIELPISSADPALACEALPASVAAACTGAGQWRVETGQKKILRLSKLN
jgi:hypothetical protein